MAWYDDPVRGMRWDDAWWRAPVSAWDGSQGGMFGVPLAAERFAQFADAGGDYDTDGFPGLSYNDYMNFVNTYLGGDTANFGKPGYEQGTAILRAPRVTPQQTSSPYQMVGLGENTRYYGAARNAGNVAFNQNNPQTAGRYRRPAPAPAAAPAVPQPPQNRFRTPPAPTQSGYLQPPKQPTATSSTTSRRNPGMMGGY